MLKEKKKAKDEFITNNYGYNQKLNYASGKFNHEIDIFTQDKKETITLKDTKPVIIGTIPIENKKKGGN